jgi:hypothetical protein
MPTNFYMFFVAALIPMIIGAVYYHPKLAGTAWMKTNGFTEDSLKEGNMGVILGISYVLSLLLAFALSGLVIHQSAVFQMMAPAVQEPGSSAAQQFNDLMSQYGNDHRSFKHGALHGVFTAIFLALPFIGINALFERRGWKYILVHLGYWIITLLLMGGLLCQSLNYAPLP